MRFLAPILSAQDVFHGRADHHTGRVQAPDPLVWERERRGAETLYWQDVEEGDEIPQLDKGAYTVTELFLLVELNVRNENQANLPTATARITVALPTQ